MKQQLTLLLLSLGIFSTIGCAQKGDIYLIVRADDIGITHTVNQACMDVYTDGIARSVEIIVPSPWFEEAVTLLNANPGYDVGVHLTLTSEWQYLKWRPLTHAASLTGSERLFSSVYLEKRCTRRHLFEGIGLEIR
ncbi:MAG: ChbG/HpnK family deacetylase [Cyclobacteriaceae bacterium]|nr:ChbG/HpnK family deacetylase [Cyclobacteriaceae bacterium]